MCSVDRMYNFYKSRYCELLNQISSVWPEKFRDKEIKHRQNKLLTELKNSKCKNHFTKGLYGITHEIRCLRFLQSAKVEFSSALDSKNKAGPDIRYSSSVDGRCINLECTACTYGDKSIDDQLIGSKYSINNYEYGNVRVITGGRKDLESIFLRRITQRIIDKATGNQNKENEPFVIWIGAGELADKCIFGACGEILLDILFGMEIPIVDYSSEPPRLYSLLDKKIKSNKDNNIDLGYFSNEKKESISKHIYESISGIIFSTGGLRDLYTTDNTFLFINPFAGENKKITAEDFSGTLIGAWQDKNGEYVFTK